MKPKHLIWIALILLTACDRNRKEKQVASAKPASEIKAVSDSHGNDCMYDNDVSTFGIGLVIVPENFQVYADSLLRDKPATYDLNGDVNKIDICPKFFKPDYGIMHFVCVAKTQKAYKVIVGYDKIKYLPKRKGYLYTTWQSYITGSFGIRRSTAEDRNFKVPHQPLRTQPLTGADTLKIPKGLEMFCPIKVKGDWINVKYDCFYNGDDHEGEPCSNYINKCKDPLSGWLKWREGNKLLIDIFVME